MGIEGQGNITPEMRATYQQQFSRSVDLFQKSLAEYEKADEQHKKDKFKDVMDKSLNIMNQTAKAAMSSSAQKQEKKLESDYQNLMANHSSENLAKVQKDIENLKGYA